MNINCILFHFRELIPPKVNLKRSCDDCPTSRDNEPSMKRAKQQSTFFKINSYSFNFIIYFQTALKKRG